MMMMMLMKMMMLMMMVIFSPGNSFSVVDSKNKPLGVTGRRVAFVLLQ